MPLTKGVEVREKILRELSKTERGLAIKDLSEKSCASRYTVAKVLERLLGEGKIEVRKIGTAKLHYLKK
jgi:predicted transcriptional regulator